MIDVALVVVRLTEKRVFKSVAPMEMGTQLLALLVGNRTQAISPATMSVVMHVMVKEKPM